MKKKDLMVILSIAVVAILVFVGVRVFTEEKTNEVGIVYLNNQEVLKFDMNEDYIYEFDGAYGHMKLEVKDEKWRIFEEECPTHICSKMGFVGKDDLVPIVCIPNNITVTTVELK